MSRIAQIGKDSVIYGVGGALGRGIGILLLPIYTRIFSPADFGTIEMLLTTASLIGALMVMGMDSAQSFYFFEQRTNGRQAQAKLVSAILQWRLAWGVLCLIVAVAAAPLLNIWLFDGTLTAAYFLIAFLAIFLMQMMSQAAELFRLLYRPWLYVAVTAGHGLLTGTMIIAAAKWMKLGIFGYFVGYLAASLVFALIGWWLARDYVVGQVDRRIWWPRLVRFGWPLLPAALAYYVMSVADRWFVQHYSGAVELGKYAVAAKLGLGMVFAVETFRKAWWPIAMDSMHGDDGPQTFRLIAKFYFALGVFGVLAVTACAPLLMRWLAAPPYQDAYPLVGLMGWQALFYGFYLVVSAGIWKAERTNLSAWLMGGAAAVNIVLNLVLVPMWGGFGAALATAMTYFLWIVASYIVAERLWPVHLPVGRITTVLLIGIAAHILLLFEQATANRFLVQALVLAGATLAVAATMLDRHSLGMIQVTLRRKRQPSSGGTA